MSLSSQPGSQDPIIGYTAALVAPHWKTRWEAAQALGELGDPRAVEPLVDALDDSNQWVRIVAAEALGQIKDDGPVQALVYALNDSSIWVRRASVVALGEIGNTQAISPLLERLLHPPNSQWPEELHDVIAKALGAIGGSAIQVLIDALEDPDVWVSSAAARALGQIGDPQAIVPLTDLVKKKNKWVQSAATQALAQIADARAVRAALTTDEAPRAFWKLMALKEIDDTTVQQVKALLQDPDEHIRARAAEVLSQLKDEGDTGPLTATLRAERMGEGIAARGEGVRSVEGGALQPSLSPTASQGEPSPESLNGVGPLVAALQDPAPDVRLAAAEALGKVGDAGAIGALTQALQDSDSRVRAAAVRALGEIGARSDA